MDRTEYNAICQSRGYIGLTDEDNTYMKGDAVVCEYFDGTATVYPHCVIGYSHETFEEYVATISLDEIEATTTEQFIEALNKFDTKYKETQMLIRTTEMEKDFEEDDDDFDDM
jgi:hypothetical protein